MGTSYRFRSSGFGFGIGMTPTVKILLIINGVLFFLTGFLQLGLGKLFFLSLMPAAVLHGMVWQLVTYMFLHGSLGHILFNMLALWMFGTTLEQTWGPRRFLRYYLICGIGAGLTVVLAALISGQGLFSQTIGASGAIYGLLLAFGLMFPNVPVLVFFLFPVPAKYFVILMGAIAFYMARADAGGGISHIAHLGGLLVGFLYFKFGRLSSSYRPSYSRLSFDSWRGAYGRWRRRRLRRKFEVYMRKHGQGSDDGPDRWVQ